MDRIGALPSPSPSPSLPSPSSFLSRSLSSPAVCWPRCKPQTEETEVSCADVSTAAAALPVSGNRVAGMSGADVAPAWLSLVEELDAVGEGRRGDGSVLGSADVIVVFRHSSNPCVAASPAVSEA